MSSRLVLATSFLAGVFTLTGCIADIPLFTTNPLSTAASMRVEVEVYKGPLSKNVSVQWGELDGLVDEAADALISFNDTIIAAAAQLGYVTDCTKCNTEVTIDPHYRSKKIAKQSGGNILPRTDRPEIDTRIIEKIGVTPMHGNEHGNDSEEKVLWCAREQFQEDPQGLMWCQAAAKMHDDIRVLLEELYRLHEIMHHPITSLITEMKTHLEIAKDYAKRFSREILSDPADTMSKDLDKAISKVNEILSPTNDDKTVRETAGLQNNEVSLRSDIIGRIQTRREDAKHLREFKYDNLEAILSSLARLRQSASILEVGGQREKLTALIVKLDRIIEFAGQMRPNPDKANIREYVKFMRKADETLRASTCASCRIQLDEKVEDNRGPLYALRDALINARGLVRAMFSESYVPSQEARRKLHDEFKTLSLIERDLVAAWPKDSEGIANEISRSSNSVFTRGRGCRGILATDGESQNHDNPLEVKMSCAQRKQIMEQVGRVAIKLKGKALYWAETHASMAPGKRYVRVGMAAFANLASEYSNQLESLADGLQWQLGEQGKGIDAKQLPLSVYLRNAETTDFLNLYTWNRAAAPAILEEMLLHPLNAFTSNETADRVRVIERLFADHNWEKINTVYGSGQGDFSMALIKDEIGNWNLKSFDSDPTELFKAYTNFTLASISKASSLLTPSGRLLESLLPSIDKLTPGQINGAAGLSDVLNTNTLHKRVVEKLRAVQPDPKDKNKTMQQIRDVLNDYETTIDTIQEALITSNSQQTM